MLQQLLLSNIKFKVSQTISLQLPRLVQQVPAHTPILPAPGEHRRHHHCHHHLHHHDLQVSLGNLTTTFHQHDHHHCQKKTLLQEKEGVDLPKVAVGVKQFLIIIIQSCCTDGDDIFHIRCNDKTKKAFGNRFVWRWRRRGCFPLNFSFFVVSEILVLQNLVCGILLS